MPDPVGLFVIPNTRVETGPRIALVAMAGTVIGSFGGIITSSKLTSYRLEKLEQKVDQHNYFAERIPVVEEKIRVLNHRVGDMERSTNHEIK